MTLRKTCDVAGCNRPADAAGGTKCAVHATISMFGEEDFHKNDPQPSGLKKTDSALTIKLERNRGAGSKDNPLFEASKYLDRTVLETADRYGECWIDKTNGEVRRTLERMFAAGLIIPLPRVARQKKYLVRYQITPKGQTELSRKAAA